MSAEIEAFVAKVLIFNCCGRGGRKEEGSEFSSQEIIYQGFQSHYFREESLSNVVEDCCQAVATSVLLFLKSVFLLQKRLQVFFVLCFRKA